MFLHDVRVPLSALANIGTHKPASIRSSNEPSLGRYLLRNLFKFAGTRRLRVLGFTTAASLAYDPVSPGIWASSQRDARLKPFLPFEQLLVVMPAPATRCSS